MRRSRCKIYAGGRPWEKLYETKPTIRWFSRGKRHVYPGCLEAGPEAGVGTRNNVESAGSSLQEIDSRSRGRVESNESFMQLTTLVDSIYSRDKNISRR